MTRVKRSVAGRKKRKKILKLAKGFRGARSRSYKSAKEAVLHSLVYAYRDRRDKKRYFRRLWTVRINAAAHSLGTNYSKLINSLNKAGLQINRKILSEIAVKDPDLFKELVTSVTSE